MLNLKLRDEFLGSQMTGTAITLRRPDNSGAAQQDPLKILNITYPTVDVQNALRAVSDARAKRPIVLIGDRGRGKSHIMAVIHHAIAAPDVVEQWARDWGQRANQPMFSNMTLERGFTPISEAVHNQEYLYLWDLLFDRHPRGEYYRGRFENTGHYFPSRSLMEQMFTDAPVALILDEFQKWFDGLPEQHGDAKPLEWASNFVQILSELASDRPDILILFVSVLNNGTEAFRQIHRNHPVLIDFHGPTAKQDRQRLLLHRLFENRDTIPQADVAALVQTYAEERFRLRFEAFRPITDRPQIIADVGNCWPFAPEMLELLEDHILMAEAAQETRDMIKILAQVYKARGEDVPEITPADFFVDDDASGVQSLLDSIATAGEQEQLREIAQSNLEDIHQRNTAIPHARELVSAIWMHSMSPGRNVGVTRRELQLDITRTTAQDDNAFESEIALLIENCDNVHGDDTPDGRLYFSPGINPRTRVRAAARNDRLWESGAVATAGAQTVFPGMDVEHLQKTLRHIMVPEARELKSRVIVLGPHWQDNPWSEVEENDKPDRWDRPVLLVVPSQCAMTGGTIPDLGKWLVDHIGRRRNTVRFLLLTLGEKGIYEDPTLIYLARCAHLTSRTAWGADARFFALQSEFDRPLREILKGRFDRFAILRNWNFQHPENCVFESERISKQGAEIPAEVEKKIMDDLFVPADFEQFITECARESWFVGAVLDELAEPPAESTKDATPYLGEQTIFEEILKIVAKGTIVVSVRGSWVTKPDGADYETALTNIKHRAFVTGQEMRNVQLGLPGVVGGQTVGSQPPAGGGGTPLPPGGGGTTLPPGGGGIQLPPGGGGTLPPGGGITLPPPGGGEIPPPIAPRTHRTEEPKTGINLQGSFEAWGIPTDATLSSAKMEFTGVSVQQMKRILQSLPSAVRAQLEVVYTEEEDS